MSNREKAAIVRLYICNMKDSLKIEDSITEVTKRKGRPCREWMDGDDADADDDDDDDDSMYSSQSSHSSSPLHPQPSPTC